MPFAGFGYTVEDHGNPAQLDAQLAAVAAAGYSHAEIDPQHWDVWHGGAVVPANLRRFVAVAERHRDRLRYTMHGPFAANLFTPDEGDRHERLLRAGLEVAAALGAEVMVVHPGCRTRPPAAAGLTMRQLMEREGEALRRLADAAERAGVLLALENMDGPGESWAYTYAVWPEQLAARVAAIGHPAIGACIDWGHLLLASRWFGFDLLAGTRALAPHTIHFHVQDLFGVAAEGDGDAEIGAGDLHLPPGWGAIPFVDLFASTVFPRCPVFNVEAWGTRFLPHLGTILAECRRLAALEPVAVTMS